MILEHIPLDEAARYMGIKGEPDKRLLQLIESADKLVREKVRPRYTYIETALEETEQGIRTVNGGILLTGNSVKKHLEGCRRAVLMAATLSFEADKLIRTSSVTDTAEALAVDCVCSAAIEQVCNMAEEEIFSAVKAPFRTWRFSPGYGDLPLSVQGDFLRVLNAQRRIGLTVSESDMLIPSKSVTAIIGISDLPVKRGDKGCKTCNMKGRCAFAVSGGSCRK